MIKLGVRLTSGELRVEEFPNLGGKRPMEKAVTRPHISDVLVLQSLVGGHIAAYNTASRIKGNMQHNAKTYGDKISDRGWSSIRKHVARNEPLAKEEQRFFAFYKWVRNEITAGRVKAMKYRVTAGARVTDDGEMYSEGLTEEFIHLVGYTGAGKTTLMHRLKQQFPSLTVKDSDEFGSKRYDEVSRKHGKFDNTNDRQLEVDRLVIQDIEQFARRFEGSKKEHAVLVGFHPPEKKHPKWIKHQLNTGSLRSTYRMQKRDEKSRSLVKLASGHRAMRSFNRWVGAKFKRLGYTPISPRTLKRKVKQMIRGKLIESTGRDNLIEAIVEAVVQEFEYFDGPGGFIKKPPKKKNTRSSRDKFLDKHKFRIGKQRVLIPKRRRGPVPPYEGNRRIPWDGSFPF